VRRAPSPKPERASAPRARRVRVARYPSVRQRHTPGRQRRVHRRHRRVWTAQHRLHRRYHRLAARGKPKQHIVTGSLANSQDFCGRRWSSDLIGRRRKENPRTFYAIDDSVSNSRA
jgi:hypothetical protein